jgi:hypothetical protein
MQHVSILFQNYDIEFIHSSTIFVKFVLYFELYFKRPFEIKYIFLNCLTTSGLYEKTTRWFKYDRDWLCVNKSQFVPVIFETLCISIFIFFLLDHFCDVTTSV